MSIVEKYDAAAADHTHRTYADPAYYYGRKAELVVSLGPRLEPGDTVFEFACADAGFAEALFERGLRYLGADLSPGMVDAARLRLGDRGSAEVGDMSTYRPPTRVAATIFFRALYYPPDRVAFFRHVAEFTDKKVVFDFSPRRFPVEEVVAELNAAGFDRVALRPFLVPAKRALPRPVAALLERAEGIPLLARALLALRFSYVVAASRS